MKLKIAVISLLMLGGAALWIPRGSVLPPGLTFAQINQPGGGGGSGTVTASGGALTANAVVLGAGGADTKVLAGFTSNGTNELDIGPQDTTNQGVLGLKGKTSGTATLTAPSAAGTSTNPITVSNNLLLPAGAANNVSVGIGETSTGFWQTSTGNLDISSANVTIVQLNAGSLRYKGPCIGFNGNADPTTTGNTAGLCQNAAGVLDFGTGASDATTAKLRASGYMSLGTKFTTNNGCTDQATTGGATAGKFQVGAAVTSCTEIITMGDTATAPNGWSCTAIDLTTIGDVTNPHQTATAATTATIVSGTVVAGDVIQFSCIGY